MLGYTNVAQLYELRKIYFPLDSLEEIEKKAYISIIHEKF
jgi:hypothetical protein